MQGALVLHSFTFIDNVQLNQYVIFKITTTVSGEKSTAKEYSHMYSYINPRTSIFTDLLLFVKTQLLLKFQMDKNMH